MKKFALAVLFSLAGLAGFGELAGLPGVVKHKFIEPGTYVSTDTWMTVSGRVEGVANKAAKKYASTSCARILPPYLHEVSFDDVYPDDAAWFYRQVGHAYTGHCSARRNGNVLERNFDWKFNEAPTFVIRISAAAGRFASLGVATIGDLVTEGQVNSHQWFPYFRCLPGHTVDGVNERGVVCEVNVTDGTWPRTEGEIHGLGAVRWALDYGTNAQQVAEYLADHVYLPEGFGGNLHWMVADATSTYIVEDGEAILMEQQPVVMTNFSQDRTGGEGYERWASLTNLATTIESQWWTKAYDRDTRPIRLTDLGPDYEQIWTYWAQYPKELHRNQKIGGIGWWQTVHCSKYDISGKALVIAVQEQEQWYRFALQTGGGGGGIAQETDPVWSSEKSGYVPWANAAHNAVTIGSRESGSTIGEGSLAQGSHVSATGPYSRAEGDYTSANGAYSHAEGNSSYADGEHSHAEGDYTSAEGVFSHSEGSSTHAGGAYSHAEGYNTSADGDSSHAEGDNTIADGDYSHAEGSGTHANGDYSHAEGYNTRANGSFTHAEGGETTAGRSDGNLGRYAHAAGFNAYATNTTAFAWNGSAKDNPSASGASVDYVPPYGDHGNGTYNINPVGGLYGFWIGETNLGSILEQFVSRDELVETVNTVKDLHWDPGLEVTWTNTVFNGHVYYITVTNTNISTL